MKKWFVTWDRSEYKEWAKPDSKGYILLVQRREKDKFLCVKAKLIMGEEGLPDFKVIDEKYFPIESKASKQIKDWMKE